MGTEEDIKKVKNRAIAILLALSILAAGVGGGFALGYFMTDPRARSISEMVGTVSENYYQEVDEDELYDRLYDALELDRFCTHYTPEEFAVVQSESEGKNVGYGLSFSSLESRARIFRVVGNSPADLAGIRDGMYVTAFGPEMQTGTLDELMAYLSSHESCTLMCGFEADGSDAQAYPVTRANYAASYCTYADHDAVYRFRGDDRVLTQTEDGMAELDGQTAYIRLTEFDGKAGEEFTACLNKMKERGKTDLVLDLRCNGGGYLNILCRIAAHLMKEAPSTATVATARYRSGRTGDFRASGCDFSAYFGQDASIRVLADENTASASECLIGAMIDYGTISYDDIYLRINDEGTARTFGKGVMQSTFRASDGNALRLTVAQIFWPKGNSIHGRGITQEDGAHAIEAPLLPGAEDLFLKKVL